jgi:hypothetical protein
VAEKKVDQRHNAGAKPYERDAYKALPLLFHVHIDTQACSPWRMLTLVRFGRALQ